MLPAEPSCRQVLAVIDWYVDCECDANTMLTVASHLDRCPVCRAQLSQVRWLKSAVRRCGGDARGAHDALAAQDALGAHGARGALGAHGARDALGAHGARGAAGAPDSRPCP